MRRRRASAAALQEKAAPVAAVGLPRSPDKASPPGKPPSAAAGGSPSSHALQPAAGAPRGASNLYLRLAVSIPMAVSFFLYCWATRQLGVIALIFTLQAFIYMELVHVAIQQAREAQTPGFSALYFYWFGVAAFFMYARVLRPYMDLATSGSGGGGGSGGAASLPGLALQGARWLMEKHVPVSFALYCGGLVLFVVSLQKRRNFRYQFAQLAYCHMALLAVVGQSTLLAANAFDGLVWVLLPTGMIIINDSFAYLAGITFGRTPLIRLSPKKTVEGFLGGALATILFALLFVWLCCETEVLGFKQLMLCPVTAAQGGSGGGCDVARVKGGLFVPKAVGARTGLLGQAARLLLSERAAAGLLLSDAQLHACVMGLFASFIAPFGGFLASGFKRAFRIKDFSSVIPGHGGFTDRFDCQLLMGAFSFVYLKHVVSAQGGEEGASGPVGHFFAAIRQSLSREDVAALVDRLRQWLAEGE